MPVMPHELLTQNRDRLHITHVLAEVEGEPTRSSAKWMLNSRGRERLEKAEERDRKEAKARAKREAEADDSITQP